MNIFSIFILAVALSMDAFAVSVCKGLAMRRFDVKKALIIGVWFGFFQALMPVIGYYLGTTFVDKIRAIDHWIVFILLSIIGGSMIKESFDHDDEDTTATVGFMEMLFLAISTSIDALAVGITFSFFNVHLLRAVSLIGITTFIISVSGVKIGNIFGTKYKSRAELCGGIILILLGLHVLLGDLGIINF